MTPKYLRKRDTDIVMNYSDILAKRSDMIPCDVAGNPLRELAPTLPPEPVETYVEREHEPPELPQPTVKAKGQALKAKE